jgi:hypothetical protein
MARPTGFLAVIACATLVGCSGVLPTSAPATREVLLTLHATDTTQHIVHALVSRYRLVSDTHSFSISYSNHASLLHSLQEGEVPYFVTGQLPMRTDQPLWIAPLGQDGIAIVVNLRNRVNSLGREEIRDIYAGAITNWAEVNGPDLPIVVFSREDGADIRDTFERLIMGDKRTTPNAQVITSARATLQEVYTAQGGIAYIPLSLLTVDVRAVAVDSVLPTLANVAANVYPLRTTLYAVGRTEPENAYRELFGWIQSPAGQELLATLAAPIP